MYQKKFAQMPKSSVPIKEYRRLRQVAFGDVAIPAIERSIGRTVFFQYMGEMCGKELKQLREDALPLYNQLLNLGVKRCDGLTVSIPEVVIRTGPMASELVFVENWKQLARTAETIEVAAKLSKSIEVWTSTHHVTAEWFRDEVLRHLCVWNSNPNAGWSYVDVHGDASIPGEIYRAGPLLAEFVSLPVIRPFNPFMEHQSEHFASVKAVYELYYKGMLDHLANLGVSKAKRKRSRKVDAWGHVGWFIHYQIKGLTADRVAGTLSGQRLEAGAVYKAVAEFARLIGLNLRPRGRRWSKTNRPKR